MAVVPFNSYNQVSNILATQGEIGTYGDLALALENNPGWRVIDGAKTITEPVVTGSSKVVPITNYIKTAPELEGGIVGATEMVEVTEEAGGAGVLATSNGLATAWSVATVVTAILQGVGLGIKAYELTPEFWVGVSNALFGTEIAYEDIEGYTIVGTIKEELFGTEEQNTTYLPYDVVQTVLNYCANYGLFNVSTTPEYEHDYQGNTQYRITKFGDWQTCLRSGLSASISLNPTLVNQTAFVTMLNHFEELIAYINNHFPGRNVITANFQMNTRTYYEFGNISVFVKIANAGAFTTTLSNKQIYSTYEWFPFSPAPGYSNYRKIELYCDNTGYYRITDDSYSTMDNFIGTKIETSQFTIGKAVTVSNIGTEYEIVRPPQIYELPDNPTIYDPTQPFSQQYPDWYNRLINTNGIKLPYDDPSLYPIPWIPVAMPEYDPITQPEKYPAPGTSPEPSPYPAQEPQPWAQRGQMPEIIPTPYPDPNPKDVKNPRTGDDDPTDDNPPTNPTPTPPIIFPTVGGEANAIFTVYKPVLAELNSLAGVLWSSNFLENLIKIFTNNPMDAIISLHMLYATPSVGGRQNIKLGCYDSGVASDVVNKQYLEIDCGTVRIPEYFGDVRDYVNTVVDVYLPFVGMRHLKTQDIIGSYVTIKAGVDVFTGTILYTINIRKSSGINQIMYAYEGNCAVALPLTGADKSRMFSVLGAAATGGAIGGVGGAVVGAFTSMMNGSQQADIQRTGNFGANSGAMGVKKPYIVVSRNTPYDAQSYSYYHGYPANKTVQLGDCTGFTRVLDCRVDGISGATDTEKRMIEEALKRGVII